MSDPRSTHRSKIAIASVAALVLPGACAPAASPTPTATPTASATASASPTPTASPSPSPSPTDDASAAECQPDEPTAESADWLELESLTGNFTLRYPDGWDDISAVLPRTTGTLLDEETLEETGLDPEGTTESDTVLDVDGTPSLTIYAFEPVSSDLEEVAARQLERIENLEGIDELIGTDLEACVGGEDAIGFEMTIEEREVDPDTGQPEPTGDLIYQRSWWIVRHDTA